MRLRLTNANVAKLAHDGPAPKVIHDEECRNFCVTVSKTGAKAFYFYGRINRHPRRIKIGDFPEMTVADARDQARTIIGKIAQGEVEPSPRRSKQKTLGDAFSDWMELHAKQKKRTWKLDETTFKRSLQDWSHRPLDSIKRQHVSDRITELAREEDGRARAHKFRALLSAVYSFAIRQGWTEANPVSLTFRPTYETRERYLSAEEMKVFFAGVASLRYQTTRDFVLMLVWTGARRQNVLSMRKDEIDRSRKLWAIPPAKYKGKKLHAIPLIPEAMEIIDRRWDESDSPFIFPGRGSSGHLMWPQSAMDSIIAASKGKLTDLRFHDIRRTLGAWQSNAGVSLRTIQQALGHADIRTTAATYTPTEVATVRTAITAYAAEVTEAIHRPDPDPPRPKGRRKKL